MADIANNIASVRARVAAACARVGRNPADVTILGVSKTVGLPDIQTALDCGITQLGENRVQELCEKYGAVKGADWHLIGHLQTNKVKYIIDKVSLIHSVESMKLAREIDRLSKAAGKTTNVLIEVNISGEASKHGIPPEALYPFLDEISSLEAVSVRGLMTMAPLLAPKEEIRQIFKKLFHFFIDISQKKYNNMSMDFLSMGMSNDFEIAVEEGANLIRVGSAIFKA